jgi:hypothetical protein
MTMIRTFLLGSSILLGLGYGVPARAQAFPDNAWGFSRTVTCSEQTITTTITEEKFSNRGGFAIAGENVAVANSNRAITPEASFTIVQPQQQFNLGIDQFTPGIDSVKVTNQESMTETHSRTFSVFQ